VTNTSPTKSKTKTTTSAPAPALPQGICWPPGQGHC
jgi:hypothetical protein